MKIDGARLRQRWRTAGGWAAAGAGALVLFVGWLGVSAETEVAKQLPYLISGGLGGLALVGTGVGLLLAEDLRDERDRIGRLEAELLEVKDLLRASVERDAVREADVAPPRTRRVRA